jgi:hypothetical protein
LGKINSAKIPLKVDPKFKGDKTAFRNVIVVHHRAAPHDPWVRHKRPTLTSFH